MSLAELPTITLATAATGVFRVESIDSSGQNAIRLKRLGVCDGRVIELIGRGDPMVLRIGESQIGISRQLAASVMVIPADDLAPDSARS